VNGSSHVVFGVAGAVAIDSVFHLSGPAIFGGSTALTGALVAQKAIFYGFAALGALTPDIDNARSTLGQRLGPVSKGIQHIAGHRRFFHSIIGLVVVAAVIYGVQRGIGLLLEQTGADSATRTSATRSPASCPASMLRRGWVWRSSACWSATSCISSPIA